MDGPSPTITKKRSGKAQKGGKRQAEPKPSEKEVPEETTAIEISPVSVKPKSKQRPSVPVASTTADVRGARRRLDLSNLDISSIAPVNTRADSIRALTRIAFSTLRDKDSGRCEVDVHVSVIRVPRAWEKFKFFLLADHTGVVSVGAGVEKFEVLKPFLEDKQFPPLRMNGFVYFKWSTKNKGEVYMTVRENDCKCEIQGPMARPEPFSAFHTIRNIIASPYYASVLFNRLIGDCLFAQSSGTKMSFMLQDSTGLALIHILNWVSQNTDTSDSSSCLHTGATVMEGSFKFENAEIDGVAAIAATIDYEDVSFKKIRHTILTKHITLIDKTPKQDYQFKFDDCVYDIRSKA